jgi:alpha-glucoside transport system substrate-binding protein
MKSALHAGVATVALLAGSALAAQDLFIAPGEGDFNWASYEAFAADHDLGRRAGDRVRALARPRPGGDRERAGLFRRGDRRRHTVFRLGQLRAADRGRRRGRLGAQHRRVPAAGPRLRHGGARLPLADARRIGGVDFRELCGRRLVGRSATFEDDGGEEHLYGVFYKVDVKSLVWYVPDNFDDFDYEVPETMEELKALTEQMVADGETPWCIGLGSGGATGWPATDWVEDMMLRTQPPEVYDQWVSNEIPFTDPAVVDAIDEFGWFARNDDFVAGGAGVVASTDFRDSPKGLFASPPQCFMHRQASFIPAFFPEDAEVGLDVDFFYFPAYEGKDLGTPVLGAGTLFTITNDSPGAQAFMEFLQTEIAHELWMAQQGGGFLTPLKTVNTELYVDDIRRALGDVLLGATTFRFDGSDLMPGAVGAGSFWTGMVDYAGGKPADEVAADIQASWDTIK